MHITEERHNPLERSLMFYNEMLSAYGTSLQSIQAHLNKTVKSLPVARFAICEV